VGVSVWVGIDVGVGVNVADDCGVTVTVDICEPFATVILSTPLSSKTKSSVSVIAVIGNFAGEEETRIQDDARNKKVAIIRVQQQRTKLLLIIFKASKQSK